MNGVVVGAKFQWRLIEHWPEATAFVVALGVVAGVWWLAERRSRAHDVVDCVTGARQLVHDACPKRVIAGTDLPGAYQRVARLRRRWTELHMRLLREWQMQSDPEAKRATRAVIVHVDELVSQLEPWVLTRPDPSEVTSPGPI